MSIPPQAIKDEARRLGFTLAGVTTPDPPPHWSVYENWLAVGRHGEMAYLARERARACRADPRRFFPECKSILVLGVPYSAPPTIASTLSGGEEQGVRGRIAAYALGMDYHLILPPRLKAIADFIESYVGHPVPNRGYTDTGPILERDLAQRAGLGWIGRNTCLITPHLGSYILLAEILLGLDLEPDPPFTADRCGNCSRCIQACPTGCILPNRTLDARRCLAYLTIEHKGRIPPDLRSLLGEWVFGCDICQMVCPWNRFAPGEGEAAFAPRSAALHLNLPEELELTPQAFNARFKDNPVKRAKLRGYLRNVAVALGNCGGPAAIPALEQAAQNDDSLVREHAAWALEQIAASIGKWQKAGK